jgi:cytochrome c oxidase subunit 2
MFEGASNLAAGVDRTFMLILAIAIFFIVGITAFMIWTVIRYNRKKNVPARQFTGSVTLEVIWTVIPLDSRDGDICLRMERLCSHAQSTG